MSEIYILVPTTPGVDDYRRLRAEAGLSPKSEESARIGLPNTWFGVTVLHEGRAIGMGRIIGDGGTAFQIVDIAVEPAHQGKGLGKRIMAALMDHLHANAPAGAYVSFIADGDARHLYAKYGFEPVMPASIAWPPAPGANEKAGPTDRLFNTVMARRQPSATTCSRATSTSCAIFWRIVSSDTEMPLALMSAETLRKTSSSPASSKSAATTSAA